MSPEAKKSWTESAMYVTSQLKDLKDDMREERSESREKFKNIFGKMDAMTASILKQETKTKILLAMTGAVGGGVAIMAIQQFFQ